MLSELNWQPLAERRRLARLTMFYKIHYKLVSVTMLHTEVAFQPPPPPTHTENISPQATTCLYPVVMIIITNYSQELSEIGLFNLNVLSRLELLSSEAFKQAIKKVPHTRNRA